MNTTATIAVIEDDETIRTLLQMLLKNAGFTSVRTAERGDTGFELVRRHKPDLVLLDLMLPGLDGLSVCRRIRETPALAQTRILMLTAKSEDADIVLKLLHSLAVEIVNGVAGETCITVEAFCFRFGADIAADMELRFVKTIFCEAEFEGNGHFLRTFNGFHRTEKGPFGIGDDFVVAMVDKMEDGMGPFRNGDDFVCCGLVGAIGAVVIWEGDVPFLWQFAVRWRIER